MTMRALVIGAIVVAFGLAAGLLGSSFATALWAAMVALMGSALLRFLHWRSGLSVRLAPGRAAQPARRSGRQV